MEVLLTQSQEDFWHSRQRIKGLFGGRGSGKTAIGSLEALRTIDERPGWPGMIIAPDYPHLVRSTWPEFMKWVPGGAIVAQNKSEKWLRFYNGTTVFYGGIDNPESWRGPNVNWLWFDEAGKKKDSKAYLILLAGVRIGPDPKIWITTTPHGKTHWLHDTFVKRFDPTIHWRGHASVYENAHNLDPMFIPTLEASYTGAWRRQELYGDFVELEGTLFERDWFDILDFAPDGGRTVRFWDVAASVTTVADHTVGAEVTFKEGHLYITHLVRGRWEWPDARRVIVQTAEMDGAQIQIGVEKNAFQLAAVQDLKREQALLSHVIRGISADRDKLARAMPWASRAKSGLVHLVRGEWNKAFLDELVDFPQGSHDDQVDAVSGAVQMLTHEAEPKIRSI